MKIADCACLSVGRDYGFTNTRLTHTQSSFRNLQSAINVKHTFLILLLIPGLLVLFESCEPDRLYQEGDVTLVFSPDTVLFDTVFTTIGSPTKNFRVKNPHKRTVKISSVRMAGGEQSVFRMNVDGIQGNIVENLEIPPRDSLFVFVEATMDPNNEDSILLIKDSILFEVNGKIQDIDLLAWGQDVHFINGEIIGTETWTNDKPYLIYNSMLVDTGAVLTIEAGTRLHFHRDSWLYVAGSLIVQGSLEDPVVFQGDRLEELYQDLPGQWNGIWLLAGSIDNQIDFASIKNGIIGIQADTLGASGNPTLSISNSRIENMSAVGILGQGTRIEGHNLLVANCGQVAVACLIGGNYTYNHCTFANYRSFTNRQTPTVLLSNYYVDINDRVQPRDLEMAYFGNTIIYGSRGTEFEINRIEEADLNYTLDHCLVKIQDEEYARLDQDNFIKLIRNENPNFVDLSEEYNFELDPLSPAKDAGDPAIAARYPFDLNQVSRISDEGPDIGAFERIEK